MHFRKLAFPFILAFLVIFGVHSRAAADPAAPEVPAGVQQMLRQMSQGWADHKLDDVMKLFHPNFRSLGRDKAAQRKYYEEQIFPYIKEWESSVTEFRQEGNIAHVMLLTRTEKGTVPFATQLILDGGVWYFYGNRQ